MVSVAFCPHCEIEKLRQQLAAAREENKELTTTCASKDAILKEVRDECLWPHEPMFKAITKAGND